MPHVASQMWAGQLERPDVSHRRAATLSARSLDFQRPTTAPPRRPRKMSNAESVPSLSLLMPENQPWDFGSIRHIRQPSHGTPPFTPRTPFSSVDSIFDLPSGVSAASSDTPISSTQSSFVAELEDTSRGLVPKPLSPRRKSQPTAASYIKELQSPAFSVSIPITLLLVSRSSSCNFVIKHLHRILGMAVVQHNSEALRLIPVSHSSQSSKRQSEDKESLLQDVYTESYHLQ